MGLIRRKSNLQRVQDRLAHAPGRGVAKSALSAVVGAIGVTAASAAIASWRGKDDA